MITELSSESKQFSHYGVNIPLNEILSNQIDTSVCPEIMESALYIYVIAMNPEKQDNNESLISLELVANLLHLLTNHQMDEKLFLIFEALAASCVNDYFRDFIIKGDIVKKILDVLMGELWMTDVMLLESIIGLIRCLYIVKPGPVYDEMKYLTEPMLVLMIAIRNKNVVVDIMFILANLSIGNHEYFVKECFQNDEIPNKILDFLRDPDENIVEAAIDLVAALTFGGFEETYQLYERGIIPEIMKMIEKRIENGDIMNKALIIMGNFFDGEARHVEIGLKISGFFEKLLKANDYDYATQTQIVNCLINATYVATNEQRNELMRLGLLNKILEILIRSENEGDFVMTVLLGLENILKDEKIDQSGKIKEKLECLLSHYNENVALIASKMISEYF